MGSFDKLLELIPNQNIGMLKGMARPSGQEEKELTKVEAIICSMTQEEKLQPDIINGSRRRRIAKGSGLRVNDVNRLLKQFFKMKKFLKKGSKQSLMSFMR